MLNTLKSGLVFLAVAGCANAPAEFTGPDGRAAFVVECDGWGEAMPICYERARAKCGGNYDVIASVDDRRPVPSTSVTTSVRNLTFSCRAI
jgi:hypothetical protein